VFTVAKAGDGQTEREVSRKVFTADCIVYHHPGGAHFLFGDGSVRFVSYGAAPIMPALATRNGGEAVNIPE
jgi:prepilin-type processing-associated H-X9-DG protein